MYNSYLFNFNGELNAIDEFGAHHLELHDSIKKELELKNDIEIIQNKIKQNQNEQASLGSQQENKKKFYLKLGAIWAGILMIPIISCFLFQIGGLNASAHNSLLFWVHSYLDAAITAELLCFVPVGILFSLAPTIIYFSNKLNISINMEESNYLNEELCRKTAELEKLQKHKKVNSIKPDDKIHKLNITTYRKHLNDQLDLIYYIAKYKEKLQQYEQLKILDSKLKEQEFSDEEIAFTKKRIQ